MKKILLISDIQYSEENNGGAESNDKELSKILSRGYEFKFITTNQFNECFLNFDNIDLFVVSNFYFLSNDAEKFLLTKKYIIIEHDYKFLAHRNPMVYPQLQAPKSHIIHEEFYQKSIFTLTQSAFQKYIFDKNLRNVNTINFSGNLWPEETLNLIADLSKNPKNGKAAILGCDDHGIKGKDTSIEFCKKFHLKYELLPKANHHDFLKNLSKYSTYVFFPRTPETLSRVCIEARLLGLSVITSDYTAAVHEPFYSLPKEEMFNYLANKKDCISQIINNIL